ncbi:1,4-alpha-glucan branching protein GlgB [Marinimicrobium sp. ABcell2]|uniref:1,4-alpha-glucan branching protein GlgB n=1 Tax=Marinimicrobium sp. ABcell2 TaxID=3069751 RepID=UPI0027B3ADCF|nr:1,4-alpha-glucan branching protein GlgB [Marinimicrobium sp. ABcell2]MDQ2075311.1 1,4-alpha-glucan branching protein GlgB [Marinimicrobium sp. ABcell2]
MHQQLAQHLPEAALQLVESRHHNPFEVLGCHPIGQNRVRVRAFVPNARRINIQLHDKMASMNSTGYAGLFEWEGKKNALPEHYELLCEYEDNQKYRFVDPYSFSPLISDYDLYLFGEGQHWHIYKILGAHYCEVDGVSGVRFATWAPGAERVSVVGNFNHWNDQCHPMRNRGSSGVWELFIPGLAPDCLYKYSIRSRHNGQVQQKTDPYGQRFEVRPATAAMVPNHEPYPWRDEEWMQKRKHWDWHQAPVSVYEVHLGSWRRQEDGQWLSYRDLAHQLVEYVSDLGFTHIELLPVTEHPLDESWGYQTTGYFAPTSRHGSPEDFRYFVDHCHQQGIGVIMDWVPGHFPKDDHALARFDGTSLYEHEDPRRGEHRDWGTLIYNYGRKEVSNFLIGSALYWLDSFHIDGLRVDAVASMLYLNYSREDGDWLPNVHGGTENLEAIDFLRSLNDTCQTRYPGTLIVAEESTSWPQVSRPSWLGGLGFSMKWNMGWMHDSLSYLQQDPIFRHYHHDKLTFGLLYAFSENFMLPLSHDEVVHGKGSLMDRMPGDTWQKHANLRLLFSLQYTYPGSKLLFMGGELGQHREWNDAEQLEWHLLEHPEHRGIQQLVKDLNHLYRAEPALYSKSYSGDGFGWIDCHDASQSVISYRRNSKEGFVIVILNFTPVPRHNYRIGVPEAGCYEECLNSDSHYYGGSDVGNPLPLNTEPVEWMGQPQSLTLTLPPLGALVLKIQKHV